MEAVLYGMESVRRSPGLSLNQPIPDGSTLLHFPHLLERHHPGVELLAAINEHLARPGTASRWGQNGFSFPV